MVWSSFFFYWLTLLYFSIFTLVAEWRCSQDILGHLASHRACDPDSVLRLGSGFHTVISLQKKILIKNIIFLHFTTKSFALSIVFRRLLKEYQQIKTISDTFCLIQDLGISVTTEPQHEITLLKYLHSEYGISITVHSGVYIIDFAAFLIIPFCIILVQLTPL